MPITYVRYVHRRPDPDPIPATFEELELEETILLFDPVAEATITPIGELYRRLGMGLRANDVVIFRGAGPSFLEALKQDQILPEFVGEKKVLALIGANESDQPAPVLVEVPGFSPPEITISINNLREAELTAILQRTQAIFTSNEFHYELPSGLHAEKFVRLGDAFRSVFDVRRITDWVFPHLTGNTIVIADTGSLLPLLIDLREQARTRFNWNVEISTLDRYPQDAVAVSDAVTAIRNRPRVADTLGTSREPTFLFLISVNSSGRLCRLFKALDLPKSKIVVICETMKDKLKDEVPCDFVLVTIPVERWDPNTEAGCEGCKMTEVIRVHRESYELLPSIKRKPVKLEKTVAESLAEFWTIVDEAKAVELHKEVGYLDRGKPDSRHFSVYLDTVKLAEHPKFRETCIKRLQEVASPDLVIIPKHENSGMVAKLCVEAHPRTNVIEAPPGRFSSEIEGQLHGTERIIVADDAIVTGITLKNLRTELFRVTQLLGITPEVNAFVMLSRPSDNEALVAIERKYRGRTVRQILFGAKLYLPGARQCPWCDELRLLTSYRHRLSKASFEVAEFRIRKLESPMVPPLLMVPPQDAQEDLKTLGSFFGTLGQKTAFAAGVCAAQTLKLQLGTLGGGIQSKVFDLEMAIHAYYEGVLLASILRTYNAVHVRYPNSDPLVEREIIGIDPNQVYPGVIAELILAAIDNKIPSKGFRKQLETWKAKDPWLTMLTEIMDIVQPI
jgi:hypothetical protein